MFRRKRKDMGGIPTASMSDVAFLLLVFFLSTTKFDIKKGLGIGIPIVGERIFVVDTQEQFEKLFGSNYHQLGKSNCDERVIEKLRELRQI